MENENVVLVGRESGAETAAVKKKSRAVWIAAALLAVAACAAVVILCMPFIRYSSAAAKLERGEFAEAQQAFESLGDYRDAREKADEAQLGFAYLDAEALLEQGKYIEALEVYDTLGNFRDTRNRIRETKYRYALDLIGEGDLETARSLLSVIGNYRDTAEVLEQTTKEMHYLRAEKYAAAENYGPAAEEFGKLGDYKDSAERAEECRRLDVLETAYSEGRMKFDSGEWLAASCALMPIRGENYKDADVLIKEMYTTSMEKTRHYAELGERGPMLAFLQVVETIDETAGAALRQEFITEKPFEKDQTYYMFDVKLADRYSPSMGKDDAVSTLLYMIYHGKTEHVMVSNTGKDKDAMLDWVFASESLFCEIVPGYGSIYDVGASAHDKGIRISFDYEQSYTQHQRDQHLALYKSFCEQSLRELTEIGLLDDSMSDRQKTEIISAFIGFYLNYDKSLQIHDVGVAVETTTGVCESYAALYHRMCNLAGILTYGQVGMSSSGGSEGRHIWLFHPDEEGNIFYADPTWADPYDIDFGRKEERPTVELFAESYLARCVRLVVEDRLEPNSGYVFGKNSVKYFWSDTLWDSHTPERTAEEIMAAHRALRGIGE